MDGNAQLGNAILPESYLLRRKTKLTILNKAFRPNREAAKEHIKLTIKYYSQMEDGVLERQLRIVSRGLYVAGFNLDEIEMIMKEVTNEVEK